MNKRLSPLILIATLCLLMGACVPVEERDPKDPWEGYNRAMWKFNRGLDKYIMRPIAQAYHYALPNVVEQGIANVVDNFTYPTTIVNLLLQGKFKEFGIAIGRILLNSTFGLGGLVDVATIEGVPKYDEDFGQTFAVWGWRDSNPYLMLPFFGPSTPRDGIGLVPELYSSGITTTVREADVIFPLVLQVVSDRAELLGTDDEIEEAVDDYLFVRDAWMQNREFRIDDGKTELPDYEFFLEEGQETEEENPVDQDDALSKSDEGR